jgi:hypothetical protein
LIASIGLLTEVVRDFRKPVTSVAKSDLVLILDSSVALELLGVSGRQALENAKAVVVGAQAIGCQIRVFERSITEMSRALDAVLRRPVSNRIGPTADALRRNETTEAFVREVARDPQPFLKALGVGVMLRTLSQFPNEHRHFDESLYEKLKSQIHWHLEPAPKEHDAFATASVMRMRAGAVSKDIFGAKFVFVTRNGMLAQLTRRFCLEEGISGQNALPPIVHQRQVAAALWLRTGSGVASDVIPRHLLLAACEKVLSLNRSVVERAQQFAKNLTPETAAQLDLLLSQDRSVQMLQDKTLNTSRVITQDNIPVLIDLMKAELVSELQAQTAEQIASEKKRAAKAVKVAKAQASSLAVQNEAAQSKLAAIAAEDQALLESLIAEVNSNVRIERRAIVLIVVMLAVLGGGFGFVAEFVPTPLKWALALPAASIAIYATVLTLFGKDLGLGRLFEARAKKKFAELVERRGLSSKMSRFSVDWESGGSVLALRNRGTDDTVESGTGNVEPPILLV